MNSSTRILVVDSVPQQLQTISRLLRSSGYEVLEAPTDREALVIACEQQPDLILLDEALPDVDGKALGARLKALPELQGSLIVIVSADDMPSAGLAEESASGVDAYIARSTGNRELLAQIKLLAVLKKTQDELRESRETTRIFLNVPTDAAILVDAEGTILNCNQTIANRFGLTRDEIIGKCLWVLYSPAVVERRKPFVDSVFRSGQPARFEDERLDMWHDNVVQPIFDNRGVVSKVALLSHDITERKLAEKRIDHLNAVLRAIRNVNQSIVREKDRDKLLQDACNSLIETRGYYNAWIMLPADDGANPYSSGRLIVAKGTGLESTSQCVAEWVDAGSALVCVDRALQQRGVVVLTSPASECAGCPLEGTYSERSALVVRLEHGGRVHGVLGLAVPQDFATDAEELALVDEIAADLAFALHNLESEAKRHEAEQRLHESEAKYRALFDRMSSGVIVYEAAGDGTDFIVRDLNEAGQRIGRVRKEDVIGRNVDDVFPGIRTLGLYDVLQQVWRTGIPQHHPASLYQDNRITQWMENYVYKLPTGEVIAVYDDITAQKQLEQETESLARFPSENPNPVLRIARDGTILYANRASELLLRVWKRNPGERLPDEWGDFLTQLFGEAIPATVEVECEGRILALAFAPVMAGGYANVYAMDITERKAAQRQLERYSEHLEEMVALRTRDLEEAQERLVRQERLAVLGQLAGGIGHELRNPLGVLSNAIYYLKMVLTDADDTVNQYLDIMSEEIDKSEKIISGLLDFSRTRAPVRTAVSLVAVISQALKDNPPPEGVQWVDEVASDFPDLYADPVQLGIVIANLIANAYQAMPKGGTLTFSATAEHGRAIVQIADSGCGIARENLARIFEPLFTTRARGIGLGLALSRNLILANGGTIDVASEEDKGTTFRLHLPLAEASERT